jgi:hyperosmotically inducible periplasmic protein
MKKSLFVFLLGVVLGALGWHVYQRKFHPTLTQRAGAVTERTREAAAEARDQTASSARELGGELGDAGIVARIKGKYLLDPDISTLAIRVTCEQGHVTLSGVVDSPALVERAARLARETGGVKGVTADLVVKN